MGWYNLVIWETPVPADEADAVRIKNELLAREGTAPSPAMDRFIETLWAWYPEHGRSPDERVFEELPPRGTWPRPARLDLSLWLDGPLEEAGAVVGQAASDCGLMLYDCECEQLQRPGDRLIFGPAPPKLQHRPRSLQQEVEALMVERATSVLAPLGFGWAGEGAGRRLERARDGGMVSYWPYIGSGSRGGKRFELDAWAKAHLAEAAFIKGHVFEPAHPPGDETSSLRLHEWLLQAAPETLSDVGGTKGRAFVVEDEQAMDVVTARMPALFAERLLPRLQELSSLAGIARAVLVDPSRVDAERISHVVAIVAVARHQRASFDAVRPLLARMDTAVAQRPAMAAPRERLHALLAHLGCPVEPSS